MNLLEYQAKKIIAQAGISIPKGQLVNDNFEFNGPVVLKVQVPTGNRGKNGGVVKVKSAEAAIREIQRLKNLSIKGHAPEAILAEELLSFDREHYFSLLVDRDAEGIRMLARVNGGIDVEESEDALLSEVVTDENLGNIAEKLRHFYGYENIYQGAFVEFMRRAFDCLAVSDAMLLEINPLVVADGRLVALDCKMEIDDNALFRHPESANIKTDANFVILDENGDTAIVANGAGLAMATVDQVNQAGLVAANFLDIGGGANTEAIKAQFARLAKLPNLNSIIVNIFAGITRCDQVAEAIVAARDGIDNLPKLFIRLHGTNYSEAKEILDNASIGLYASLSECIKAAQNA